MNLMVSTVERRRRLSSLWFVCQCSRCAGPDLVRQMRCPSCGAPRCLPDYGGEGGRQAGASGDWAAGRPLHELVPDAASWSCRACGGASPASAMPLGEEEELGELVPRAMQGAAEHAGRDSVILAQLRARAASAFGEGHWTFALATFAWLQKCYLQLRCEPLVAFSEADLRRGCSAVAAWLEACAPENAEQRYSALFVALRLAREVGGGPCSWGYDPADPLGGGLCAAERVRAHGWRLSEQAVEGGETGGAPQRGAGARGGAPCGAPAGPGTGPRPHPGTRRPFRGLWQRR
uniref:Uncharacterized protein n=2 Tax=Alexandrium monilatum TaxID=311494 RepID=A0A7S4QBV7_9DINO